MGAHAFPLRLLAPRLEIRAATGVDTVANSVRWLDRLFSESAAMRLGVTMESVAPGIANFPVTTGGASAAQRGKAQAVADAAWTVGVTELKPTRNGVRAVFAREDQLRVPGLEDALRRDLSAALTEGVDRVIFLGDATADPNAGDIVGFVGAGITETTLTQTNKVKGTETLAAFTGMIDGKHAGSLGEMNVVAAVGAARLWEATALPAPVTTAETLAAYLRKAGLSWMARGDIETATANGDFGAFVGLTRGIAGAAVAPVWEAGQLIVDPYTGAAKGEVALTLSYFWNFAIPRTSQFPASQVRSVAMPAALERRAFELRSEDDGAVLAGVALPYASRGSVGRFTEEFRAGGLQLRGPSGVLLNVLHVSDRLLGPLSRWRVGARGRPCGPAGSRGAARHDGGPGHP